MHNFVPADCDDSDKWWWGVCLVDNRFILCEELDEVYQSLDDEDADDNLVTEAAELQQRHEDWLSQIDFDKYVHHYHDDDDDN